MDGKLVGRFKKVSYMDIGTEGTPQFKRMQGFTTLSASKKPKEYTRQYVDMEFEETDVVGYSSEVSFAFDQYMPDSVQAKIVEMFEYERTGSDTYVDIVVVDYSAESTEGGYPATKRTWAVIPDAEGGSMDAYTYSGKFSVKSEITFGTAVPSDKNMTVVFTAN